MLPAVCVVSEQLLRPMELLEYECFCGKRYKSHGALEVHMSSSGCLQFAAQNGGKAPLPPSVAAAQQQEKQKSEKITEQGKRARARTFAEEQRKVVVLELAMQRYVKCVQGTSVDAFKAMHTRANARSKKHVLSELNENISGKLVDESMLQYIEDLISNAFDTYRGIETEHMELKNLKKIIPIVEPVPRSLPGIKTKAWDFLMDEVLLRILNYSPKACAQTHSTIVDWRAKPPSKAVKIITDVIEAKVFLQHKVFGEYLRVTRREAQEIAAKGGHIQWGIILYGDAFVVCFLGCGLACAPHPVRATSARARCFCLSSLSTLLPC